MQIVIDIPDYEIPEKQDIISVDIHFIDGEVCECNYGFQVLPKGHGRSIDVIKLKAKMFGLPKNSNRAYWDGVDAVGDLIDKAPTIIEADGGDAG